MERTATQIITSALKRIGRLGEGQTASGAQLDDALTMLNEMVDAWAANRALLFTSERNVHNLTANDGSYTIGTSANFNQDRPLWIDAARIIPDSTVASDEITELPCRVITTPEEWAEVVMKGLDLNYPFAIYYPRDLDSSGFGTITLYPIPTDSNVQLVLYTPKQLSQFANATTAYDFSQGYPEALIANLALRLAVEYGKDPGDDLRQWAKDSKALIEHVNIKVPILRCGPEWGGGGYDIRSDEVLSSS